MRSPRWTADEDETLRRLYEDEGDKVCLPWWVIRDQLNAEHENNRSLVACQLRYYKLAKANASGEGREV